MLKVLSNYGYTGSNTPMDINQVKIASMDVIRSHGDQGVINILKAHPEYGAFEDLFSSKHSSFLNTTGSTGNGLLYKMQKGLKPFDDLFIALSVFSLAYFIINGVKQ